MAVVSFGEFDCFDCSLQYGGSYTAWICQRGKGHDPGRRPLGRTRGADVSVRVTGVNSDHRTHRQRRQARRFQSRHPRANSSSADF